jgi:putative aldouronate transport system permease protein
VNFFMMNKAIKPFPKKPISLARRFESEWQIYLLLLPAMAYIIIFEYLPMYGIQVAFRDYKAVQGILGSRWVGLEHYRTFFSSFYWKRLLVNTFLLNFYGLIWGFPVPIILALLLNRVEYPRMKKFTQTAIYIPHFISTVVIAGMIYMFLSPTNGIINRLIVALGGKSIFFMVAPEWFRTVFIASGIWQGAGWGTIVYLAALTSIDPEMYEAATIDGATILQKIRYIDIPSIIPIAMMLLILNSGSMLSSNTQKALLLQTSGNIPTSDIIGLYIYNVGLGQAKFSYTAAIGLLLNVINFFIIMTVNTISKKTSEISMI